MEDMEDTVEETVTGLEDGAGLAELEGIWWRGSDPGPSMVLSISELIWSAMFLLSILGRPVSGELEFLGWTSASLGSISLGLW